MFILQALYFMLPAYLANMAPVFATKILAKRFNTPIDFNKKFKGLPILGTHKTWRGLIAAIIVAVLTVLLQKILYPVDFFQQISLLDYSQVLCGVYGFLFGFGVILADAIKSFFKRRSKLKPGQRWFFWDQLDFLGGLILIMIVFIPPLPVIITILIISPVLPIITNYLGYKLKIKKVAW